MKTAKELREERASVWEQMLSVEKNAEDRGGMNAEDKGQWDKLEGRLNDLTEDLDRAERRERIAGLDFSEQIDAAGGTDEAKRAFEQVDDEGNTRADYDAAFELFVRFGMGELEPEQRKILRSGLVKDKEIRAQASGTDAAGGFTVPALFRDKLVEVVKDFSGVRKVAEQITTDSGANLPWPTNDDTGNEGAILGENTQVSEQDLDFGDNSLDVFMYTSKLVRVSLQLIQDSALNINTFLPRKLGERLGRVQNRHFTVGSGTGQPLGLVTGLDAGQTVTSAAGNVADLDYDDYVDAMLQIDPAVSGDMQWMTSQSGLSIALKKKDTQGRPLWQPSLIAGQPDTFLGKGIVLNNHMDAPAASKVSWLYGDFRQAYVVRDVRGLQVLRLSERYADFLQVGFLGFMRSGGTVQDTQAYAGIKHPAA